MPRCRSLVPSCPAPEHVQSNTESEDGVWEYMVSLTMKPSHASHCLLRSHRVQRIFPCGNISALDSIGPSLFRFHGTGWPGEAYLAGGMAALGLGIGVGLSRLGTNLGKGIENGLSSVGDGIKALAEVPAREYTVASRLGLQGPQFPVTVMRPAAPAPATVLWSQDEPIGTSFGLVMYLGQAISRSISQFQALTAFIVRLMCTSTLSLKVC